MNARTDPLLLPADQPGTALQGKRPTPRLTTSRICRRVCLVCSAGVAAVGLTGLVGHLFAFVGFLTTIHPNSIPMVEPSAIFFLVMGTAVAFQVYRPGRYRWPTIVVCSGVVLWSLMELLEFGITRLGREDELSPYPLIGPLLTLYHDSGMSPGAAGSFLLCSLALLAINMRPSRVCARLAARCSAVAIALNLLFLLGYLTYQRPFREVLEIEVAFPAAVAFVLLGVALLNRVGPRSLWLRGLASRSMRGRLLRAFLPAILAMLVLGECIRHQVFYSLTGGDVTTITETTRDVLLAVRGLWILVIALAVGMIVYRVAGTVGRSLEKARQDLNRTLEDLQLARHKAENATVARDFFLAQVSHELRTPLNHVLGFCQLLEMTPLDDTQRDDVGKIRRAGNQLQALIEDILDYQKIIMGQIPMEWENIEASAWIAEIAESMEPKVRDKHNRLEVRCDPGLGWIWSDRKRFRQVLTNLLSNAAKFTRHGDITVSARGERVDGRDWIVVSVADTGKGISAENLGKLFKPFSQLSDKRDNPDGTGLGLAICKILCEKMGGAISVRSAVGQGSTFTFRLPATHDSQAAAALEPALPPREKSDKEATLSDAAANGLCSVLVVDDDPQVGEMMKRFLEKQGYAVTSVGSGAQALEIVKSLRPDVIVLDVLLPDLDGWGVLAALKADSELSDIPVIMLSIVDDRSKGLVLGADEYVTKPVDWDRLAALLGKYRAPEGGILVVDDDEPWRELCRRALEQDGWRVTEAADGAGALRSLPECRPGLVLLDLMLPVMDGFEFLEHVRRQPQWRDLTIVVMTAKELTDEDRRRLNGGVQAVLEKGSRSLDELLEDVLRGVKLRLPPRLDTKELVGCPKSC